MARYFIEDVNCGVTEGGMACGPVDGSVIAEVKVKTDANETFYISLAEVIGVPNFFKTDRSTFNEQMQDDLPEELVEYLNSHLMGFIDYVDIYGNPDMEYRDLLRYISYIVRSSWEECKPFMEATKGKDNVQ